MASKGIASWRSGRMVNGVMMELPTLAKLTQRTPLPTPTAQDYLGSRNITARRTRASGKRVAFGWTLTDLVTVYPERGTGYGPKPVPAQNAAGSPINPAFSEWLMGYPQGWTEL